MKYHIDVFLPPLRNLCCISFSVDSLALFSESSYELLESATNLIKTFINLRGLLKATLSVVN